jgi:hypothetical protein
MHTASTQGGGADRSDAHSFLLLKIKLLIVQMHTAAAQGAAADRVQIHTTAAQGTAADRADAHSCCSRHSCLPLAADLLLYFVGLVEQLLVQVPVHNWPIHKTT